MRKSSPAATVPTVVPTSLFAASPKPRYLRMSAIVFFPIMSRPTEVKSVCAAVSFPVKYGSLFAPVSSPANAVSVASRAWKSFPKAVPILEINPFRSPSSSTSSPLLLAVYCASAAAIKLACRITLLTCALDAFPAVNPDKSAGNASHSSCDITLAFRSVANALKSFFAIRVILPMLLHQNH
ncbi:Uncharacterised protein [Escherichia fergusonii]|nr:Uncharacterised protein [Escherichia fergusonii]